MLEIYTLQYRHLSLQLRMAAVSLSASLKMKRLRENSLLNDHKLALNLLWVLLNNAITTKVFLKNNLDLLFTLDIQNIDLQ